MTQLVVYESCTLRMSQWAVVRGGDVCSFLKRGLKPRYLFESAVNGPGER